MRLSIIFAAAFLGLLGNTLAAEGGAEVERAFAFEKELAPVIAQAQASLPELKQRYLAGLPEKTEVHLVVQYSVDFGNLMVAEVLLTGIKPGKKDVSIYSGKVVSEPKNGSTVSKGAKVSFLEKMIYDWKIIGPSGAVEGDLLGRFVSAHDAGTDPITAVEKAHDLVLNTLNNSKSLTEAFDRAFLELFGDPKLDIFRWKNSYGMMEWPALAKKFQATSAKDLTALLQTRAGALQPPARLHLEVTTEDGKPLLNLTMQIVTESHGLTVESSQILHIEYKNEKKIGDVTWGLRYSRILEKKPS